MAWRSGQLPTRAIDGGFNVEKLPEPIMHPEMILMTVAITRYGKLVGYASSEAVAREMIHDKEERDARAT
jgi:hypothetical protein